METFEQSFNAWMAPAGIANSPEIVAARKKVALGLRDADVSDYELVMAAAGKLDAEVGSRVEELLQEQDPTHVTGTKNLVQLLCAAAVMSALERRDEQATDLALLVKSALFRGMKPRLYLLTVAAEQVLSAAASRSRARLAPRKASPRAQAAGVADTVDPAAVVALASRLEQVIVHFESQLSLLNEEVDILWWARSGLDLSGKPWMEMADLQRAVSSTAEVSAFIAQYPITGAIFEVLRGIADGPKRKTATFDEVSEAAAQQSQLPTIESSLWLLPLLSGVRIARTYPPEARAGVVAAELGLEADAKFKIIDIPEQLMRELAILKRVL